MNEAGLSRLIENAGLTADALNIEDKNKNRIRNAKGEAEKIEDLTKDLYILQIIREELAKIPESRTTGRNIFLQREQTSLEFARGMSQNMSQKQEELTKNVEKELNRARVMEDNLFEKVRHPSPYGVPLTINKRILNELDKNKSIQKYSKSEEAAVKTLLPGHSQIILTSNPNNQVRQSLAAYKRVIEAKFKNEKEGLTKPEYSSTSPNIDAEYTTFLNNDITKIDERIKNLAAYHPLADTTRLKNMRNEIATVSKQFYELKKNRIIIDRLINLATQMSNGQKEQLIIKLEKEKKEIDKNINLLQDRLAVVKQNFEAEFKKVEEYAINLENTKKTTRQEEQPAKKVVFNPDVKKYTSGKRKNDIKELKEAREQLLANKDKIEEPKRTPQEQKKMYEKYKEARDIFDNLQKSKGQFKNDEVFKQHVVSKLGKYGSTYEEIVENLSTIRDSLEVTAQIRQIMNEVRSEYKSYEEMTKEEANGLTSIENKIIGRLLTTRENGNISEELKAEIEYYVKKHGELESDLKPAYLNKQNYEKETYQKIVDKLKIDNYINTELLDEVGLVTESKRSR